MSFKHITLTGLPGAGKTTLIKKLYSQLKQQDIKSNGFYTEEIRDSTGKRIGFDVITLDGKRGKLARSVNEVPQQELTRYKVGQYVVFPTEFENLVLPLFKDEGNIMIIDEIGKMELFSAKFKIAVEDCYKKHDGLLILATIPLKATQIPLIEEVRQNPLSKLFTVNNNTRNSLDKEILTHILNILNK